MPILQRLAVVTLIAGIVCGLIATGCSPGVAISVAAGIVLVSRDVWSSSSSEKNRTVNDGSHNEIAPLEQPQDAAEDSRP